MAAATQKVSSARAAPVRTRSSRTGRMLAALNIDVRTAVILAGSLVIALAAAVLIQVTRDRTVALRAGELRLTDLAWAGAQRIREALQTAERVLDLGAAAVMSDRPNPEAALATLTRLEPLIINIVILGPDGMLRASKQGAPSAPRFFTNQPYYEAFRSKTLPADRFIGPFADAQLGASPVALFVRMTDQSGAFAGVAIALLDTQALARRIGNYTANVSAALVDPEGRVISAIAGSAPVPAASLGAPLAFAAEVNDDGSPSVRYVPGRDGEIMAASAGLLGYGGAIIVSQPVDVPLTAWTGSLWLFVMLVAGPMLIAFILAAALMRQNGAADSARARLRQSENRFEALVTGARAGIAEISPASGIVKITPSLALLLGQAGDGLELSRDSFRRLVHPDDMPVLQHALDTARRTRTPVLASVRLAHAEGRWLWMRFTIQPASDGRLIAIGADIHQEKESETKRSAAELRFRDAIENAPHGVVLWDRNDRLIAANKRFIELMAVPRAELRPGTTRAEFTAMLLRPGDEADSGGTLKSWRARRLEGLPDGHDELLTVGERWLHATHRATSDGGELTVLTDVTTLKTQEAELSKRELDLRAAVEVLERQQGQLERQAEDLTHLTERLAAEKQRAEEASRAKTEFLAHMSHELRTPLNHIMGFSDAMERQIFGPLGHARYVEYAGNVVESGRKLLELITDILDMSKIESGTLEVEPARIAIAEIVSETFRLIGPFANDRKIKLLVDVPAEATAYADKRAVKRILLNLLSNSVKYSQAGAAARVRARAHGAYMVIAVEDTGRGIDPADISRLGQPFVQLRSGAGEGEGTGLGLAVAKALVALNRGTLAIESAPGKGTIVRFTLPIAAQESQLNAAE